MHDNAFEGIWFVAILMKIPGALATDLMHAFLHSFIPYVAVTIVPPHTNRKHTLDLLVDSILIPV